MSTIKKLTALLSCLVIICGLAVSCTPEEPDNNGNEGGAGEQINFPTDKYVATVNVEFESDDSKMKDAISAMGDTVYTVTADGTNLKIEAASDLGNVSLDEAYTYIGGVLYHAMTLSADGKSASSFEKATMNDSSRDTLLGEIGPGASIGIGDFLKIDTSKNGNYKTYTCSKISSASADSLCKVFASKFEGMGATVRLDGANYTLELLGDANNSSILSLSFTVTMDGTDYAVTMNMSASYEYKDVSITSPENAEKYVDTALSDIIG